MNNNRLFLDIHVIQTVPPSNINRDDTGSPKTAQYGGVRRARISSQAWKKAMRDYFISKIGKKNLGNRTKKILHYIGAKIVEIEPNIKDDQALKMAKKLLEPLKEGKKKIFNFDKDSYKSDVLFFLSEGQAIELAKAALREEKDSVTIKNILNSHPTIDIALFGRMLATDPSLNEDASAQVAHSISTHAVQTEFDYFTGLDDLSDEPGAAMIETTEFNSSTLYRYANVAIHELLCQLENKKRTLETLDLFIEAFTNSMPTGMSNRFANQTLPQTVLITIRSDRPVNLVSAFEEPVKSNKGYVQKSSEKLFKELKNVEKFVKTPEMVLYVTDQNLEDLDSGQECASLKDLLDTFNDKMNALVIDEAE